MNVDDATQLGVPDLAGDLPVEAGTSRDGASLEVIGTANDPGWTAVLGRVVQHDFHHLAGYHRLAEERGEGAGLLFVYGERGYLIAVPLLLRSIDGTGPTGLLDATSVYGYAGPVASHAAIPRDIVQGFQAALREELVRRRVITVFSRLHPLIPQLHLLAGLGEIRPSGLTVSVDLTVPLEDQWAGYSKDTRRLIRRARDAGVVCVHDRELAYLAEWADIYRETMDRVGASASYRFDAAYFQRMAAELGPVLHLFVAFVGGRAAAAGLFTLCDGLVQAHLGGSRAEYAAISPVRVVDDSARCWAAEAGARVFHLGGGVAGREDSLFRYKAGFSSRRHTFTTWRWVVDEGAYRDLCAEWLTTAATLGELDGSEDYFPAYRQPPAPQP